MPFAVDDNPSATRDERTPVPRRQAQTPRAKSAPARPAGVPSIPDVATLRVSG